MWVAFTIVAYQSTASSSLLALPLPNRLRSHAAIEWNGQRCERPPLLGAQAGGRGEQPGKRFDGRLQGAASVRTTPRQHAPRRRDELGPLDRNSEADW